MNLAGKRETLGEFSRCPVVRTQPLHCNGLGSIPGRFACQGKEFGFIFNAMDFFKVFFFFLLWTIFKVLTGFSTILLQFLCFGFYFIFWLQSM